MLGIVFTEFVDMVADAYSEDMVDDLIEAADLPSEGVYTSVGSYDHHEILTLVTALSARTGIPVPDLVRTFGKHLFGRFQARYGGFFEGVTDCFGLLACVENHIHVEVRKLYPDAELPTFACTQLADGGMEMVYRSNKPFADLAEGLIQGAADHFGESLTIERKALQAGEGVAERFVVRRNRESAA